MVAFSFKKQFAEPILAGTKGGTIRADRKRHARPGEELQLYTGMRTKQCRLIARKTCLAVQPIRLDFSHRTVVVGKSGFGCAIFTEADTLDAFAIFDGFEDWKHLHGFWIDVHDQPSVFDGVHICWLDWPEALRT